MGVINVLSFAVANLIAAGEVVDRPASVIKELMENAIDAGATRVTVEIQHGGVSLMRVTDNGCGMLPEDLPVAIRRHATSKIREAADLEGIVTLGFRGEALAAIASVSDLRIISKTADAPFGAVLQAHGGEHITVTEQGCSTGTSVIVENLFANVPARRKFLKKDVTETVAVTAYVEKIALSTPGLAVRLVVDGTVKLETAGDGNLKSTIYALFGREFANRLIEVNGENEGISVKGFIGRSDNYKANRNFENFFVNGRYVKSKTATAALEQAFTSYMPPEKFPCCVLNIDVNPARVDVNVHPAKLEVKFSNEKAVFEAIYYTVRTALESNATRPSMNLESVLRRGRLGVHGRLSDATVSVENERPQALRTRQLSYDLTGRSQPQPQERMTAEEFRQMMHPDSGNATGQAPAAQSAAGRDPTGQSAAGQDPTAQESAAQNTAGHDSTVQSADVRSSDTVASGTDFSNAAAHSADNRKTATDSAFLSTLTAGIAGTAATITGQTAPTSENASPSASRETMPQCEKSDAIGSASPCAGESVPLPDPAVAPLLRASLPFDRENTAADRDTSQATVLASTADRAAFRADGAASITDAAAPIADGIVLNIDGSASSSKRTASADHSVTSADNGIVSTGNGVTPANSGAASAGNGVTSAGNGVTSPDNRTVSPHACTNAAATSAASFGDYNGFSAPGADEILSAQPPLGVPDLRSGTSDAPANTPADGHPPLCDAPKDANPVSGGKDGVTANAPSPSAPAYRLVGDVFHSYVIVELEDKMLIIDQHAAHERILFEQLKSGLSELEPCSQMLMLPVEVMMTSAEVEALGQFDDELHRIGFSLRYARNTVSADAIPEGVETGAVPDMLQTMAGRLLDNTGSVKLTRDIIFEKALYQAACKAAIKAGRVYAPGHLEWLVDRLMQLPDVTFCPHGRPVAMELSKRTLDRQFDRMGF